MTTTTPTPNPFNATLAREVLEAIDANPQRWDQEHYNRPDPTCGTAMCFAGWTVTLSGIELDPHSAFTIWTEGSDGELHQDNIPDAATRLLGLADGEHEYFAQILFRATNTREDLGQFVDWLAAPDTFDGLTALWAHAAPWDEPEDDDEEEQDPNPHLTA